LSGRAIRFMPTAFSTNSFVCQRKRYITGVRIRQKSGQGLGMFICIYGLRPDFVKSDGRPLAAYVAC
jgi:hypothetical protein